MAVWRGYVLLQKHPALTGAEWRAVLEALRQVLNHTSQAPWPAWKLHYRLSLDQTQIIFEAAFNRDDLDIQNLNRLAKYISQAVPRFTPAQIAAAMRDLWLLFGGLNATYEESALAARAFIAANRADWEPE